LTGRVEYMASKPHGDDPDDEIMDYLFHPSIVSFKM
jgi:hypothetical protein